MASGGTTPKTNDVPITNLSGAVSSEHFWVLTVPAGVETLTVSIRGGAGDADLYGRHGDKPSTAAYDCRPFVITNQETCTFKLPAAGQWYFMQRGTAAYSGVTLVSHVAMAPHPVGASLVNGVPLVFLAGAPGTEQYFTLVVPPHQPPFTVSITGGVGDADLYLNLGEPPTTAKWQCRPFLPSSNETCTNHSQAAGTWFVMVRGNSAFSGVTLKAVY